MISFLKTAFLLVFDAMAHISIDEVSFFVQFGMLEMKNLLILIE